MKTMFAAAAMASALSFSVPATAGFFDLTLAPFVGASVGQASYDFSCAAGSSCDDKDTAYKIYGGLEVNEYISMEVGYVNLGETKVTGTKPGTASAHGMMMQVVGTYAPNPSVTLIARGGMNILNYEVDGPLAGTPNNNDGDTDVAWSAGLGAQYNLTKSMGLRMEWERYFKVGNAGSPNETDIDLVTAGIVFKF